MKKSILIVICMMWLVCFAQEAIWHPYFNSEISITYKPCIIFDKVFCIHQDSVWIEWYTRPDSAGVLFAEWFRKTYDHKTDSLNNVINDLNEKLLKIRKILKSN